MRAALEVFGVGLAAWAVLLGAVAFGYWVVGG